MADNKLHILPGGNLDPPVISEQQTVAAIASMDAFARVMRAKYIAMIKAGFTAEQALTLCKNL